MHVSPSTATDRDLLRRYHEEGDASAREVLVERHLPLVRSLARRYAGRGESLDDIEQVGAIGLIKAIDRYELSRDVPLTARLGRSPSIAEIASEFETSPEQVLEALEAGSAYAPASLSVGPVGEEGELDPMETIGSEDQEFERTDD